MSDFDSDRFVADVDAVVRRHVEALELPDRFVAADAAVAELGLVTRELRSIRGKAAKALRDLDPKTWTWPAIGELVDVSAQRAEQYAQQAEDTTT